MISLFKYLNEHLGETRERSKILNILICGMIFNNPNDLNDSKISSLINVSPYLIQKSREIVKNINQNQNFVLQREFKNREVFGEFTANIVDQFWENYTIAAHGNQTASKRLGNKKSETHPVKYIPCTIDEFYEQFVKNPKYGPICRTVRGELRIPKLNYFLKRKPYWMRPWKNFRTGYCGICMQGKTYHETFRCLIKRNCSCGSLECKTFQHQTACDPMMVGGICTDCSKCTCNNCSECFFFLVGSHSVVLWKLYCVKRII